MPTLADLQALRDKAQNQQPDPGITVSGANPNKTPTFADLQALRDKTKISPEAKSPEKEPYTGQILPIRRTADGKTELAVPGIIQGVIDAVKAPGDVYSGKIKPGSPEFYQKAQDVAGLAAGSGFGNKIRPPNPVSKLTKTGEAARNLGLDTVELASKNEGRVAEALHPEKVNEVVPNAIAGAAPTGSPIADSAVKNSSRMYNLSEDNYTIATKLGAGVTHELDDKALGALSEEAQRYKTLAEAKGASEVQKSTNSFFQQLLNKLGKPLLPIEQTETITKQNPSSMRLSTRDYQYRPLNEHTEITADPASVTRKTPKGTYETTRTVGLGERTLSQKDKTKGVISSPGKETVEKKFTPNAEPHKPTTLNDLVEAEQLINRAKRGDFGQIDSTVLKDARSLVGNAIQTASKSNPKFVEAYNKGKAAYRDYQAIYGEDSATAKHFGLTEQDLTFLRNGNKDPVLRQKVDNIYKKIRTDSPKNLRADMEGVTNLLGKEGGSEAMRNKVRDMIQEASLNRDKINQIAPALKTMLQASNVPAKVWEPALENLKFFSKRMKQYGVKPGAVEDPPSPFLIQAFKTLFKVASYTTFDLGRSAVHTGVSGAMKAMGKEPPQDLYMLSNSINKSLPQRGLQGAIELQGPAVGAALGSNMGNNR